MKRLLLGLENKLAEYNSRLMIAERGLSAGHPEDQVILGFIMNPEEYNSMAKVVKHLAEQCPVSKALATSKEHTQWSWNESLYFIEPFDGYNAITREDWVEFTKEEEEE